ncbi:MAG: hypothetical protein KAI79_15715 [Bacteroidales bacterium]|nr:hypothetical protein [Bacteroidales bacterium]
MSGFFGVYNRNGNPVDKKIANDMLEAISYWEPDEKSTWINGSVALGHTMLWNTPESKYEYLPLAKDICILTMDARIDNRNELTKELELPDRPLEEIGDSEFILAAYARWGEECPKYLLGDFAFAIWDSQKEQLFCARDHIGIKLFHFYLSADLFIFSNDIEGVLSHPDVSHKLNDNIVADYLKDVGIHRKSETFFENIHKLPPATSLTVTLADITEKEYWRIENSPSVRYNSFEEYVEKLKELFDCAVEARLRTSFPVAAHLSGGIDSSPIAVKAARKLRKKNKLLYAYNWNNIPDNGDEYEFGEWNFSRRIAAEEINIEHQEFYMDPYYMVKQYNNHNIFTKGTMKYWKEYYVQDMVKKTNARTLLSGWGGDELISYNGRTYIAGLFSEKKLRQAFKYLFDEKKYQKYTWNKFVKYTLRQILSHDMILYLTRKKKSDLQFDYFKFLTQEFSIFMTDHKSKEFDYNVVGVRKRQFLLYNYGHLQDRVESWALSAFSKKIEYRYPLLDKRIVEFAIGIPEEMYYPIEGQERQLIKNAIKDLLPSDILWTHKPDTIIGNRTLKKYYSDSFKILKIEYNNMDCRFYKNKYLDCSKIKKTIQTFDFENTDTSKWGNMASAIILLQNLTKK